MSRQIPSLKIFCDFDGTVTKNDILVSALGKFIKDENTFAEVCYEFASNLISSRECTLRELSLVENFSFEQFNKYLDVEEFDEYFKDFVKYCEEKNYEIILLSEGLDYYINYLMRRESINLKVFCNKLIVKEVQSEDGKTIQYKLSCEFPFEDEHCRYCGVSKRNIILTHTDEYNNEVSVFIGDGVSDFCASNYADIVFAKKSLASYCWKHNITYYDYKNFSDVQNKLEKLLSQGRIKQRQSARLLRRDVYLGG